jgi:hypothetical protein
MSTLIEQTDGESDLPAALASSGDMGFDQQVGKAVYAAQGRAQVM